MGDCRMQALPSPVRAASRSSSRARPCRHSAFVLHRRPDRPTQGRLLAELAEDQLDRNPSAAEHWLPSMIAGLTSIRGVDMAAGGRGPRWTAPLRGHRAGTSRRPGRHLTSDQHVDLTPVALVVRQALVHLCPREAREASRDDAVDRLAGLQQPHDVVHSDPGSTDDRVPSAQTGLALEVRVGDDRYPLRVHLVQSSPGDVDIAGIVAACCRRGLLTTDQRVPSTRRVRRVARTELLTLAHK